MSFDKEPLAMFLFGFLALLCPTVTILVFLIRWLLTYSARWEFIVSLILICVCGIFILFIVLLLCKIGKELFIEIKTAIEIYKEEKEEKKKSTI
ncbi:MAG: hypothetical protein JXA54_12620 [Candidatus Heimdallarchaeota archaeon]|nr:hypothetical protein [Candidatus Heimdallarchaeota archaeon]